MSLTTFLSTCDIFKFSFASIAHHIIIASIFCMNWPADGLWLLPQQALVGRSSCYVQFISWSVGS